jgi:hypothetical protein
LVWTKPHESEGRVISLRDEKERAMSHANRSPGVRGRAFRAITRSAGAILALLVLAPRGPTAHAEETKRVKLRLRPIASTKGIDLYRGFCLQCHGTEGKGDGPLATGLRTPPVDLTRIAERNGGHFSRVGVAYYIMGDRPGGATHLDVDWNPVVIRKGVADDMPLWSYYFGSLYPDDNVSRLRFESLAKYVESIQVK